MWVLMCTYVHGACRLYFDIILELENIHACEYNSIVEMYVFGMYESGWGVHITWDSRPISREKVHIFKVYFINWYVTFVYHLILLLL